MERDIKNKVKYQAAKKRVKDIKGFYIHLLVYLFINTAIILVGSRGEISGDEKIEFADFFTAFFWGIGLFAHWASVFVPNMFFGKNWEERKIQQLMEEDKISKQKWE
ncbi:MAG TPA: 2TM domain-containing protein [Salinimicrobium sp.]|nr:2TM domain-containing protein [Salinimicrobium sp.]